MPQTLHITYPSRDSKVYYCNCSFESKFTNPKDIERAMIRRAILELDIKYHPIPIDGTVNLTLIDEDSAKVLKQVNFSYGAL